MATEPFVTAAPVVRERNPVGLVFGCTVLGAAAQVLLKTGANTLPKGAVSSLLGNPVALASYLLAMATNVPLMAGYCLYGLSTALLVLALRKGQLSLLYPVISLTYVWVTILSVVLFQEALNGFKTTGLVAIMLGVAVLGRDGRT